VKTFGQPQAQAFRWPLNRIEALTQLTTFVDQVLPHFGDYQDAMHTEQPFLFHSLISFALNTKMLHPREVIEAAQAAWHEGRAPISAVEGFIRQILGWREYVRGVYWSQMPGYTDNNALDHNTALPDWFWTGQTKMRCLSYAIGQSLQTAYAHHIQRLMVIGNFALLAGINPQAVHHWYLGVYIDAFEWVEAPNTLGMSQFADDGLLATKPYVSSAAYINRMSDYCKGCHYDKKERIGQRACPFNALYWDFYQRHASKFSNNPRIGMAYRQLAKMSDKERTVIAEQAMIWRDNLNEL
jgi:deoxyribodipyrimidine photolyase-related protein